MNVIIVQVRSG